ncbi:MAG: aminoglycoside phosphotransferase family protein, partial [Ruminiclostridium sp.]|nr:aminoglycoside phosphotransferase family protein [Ruminiclostridium sp.]
MNQQKYNINDIVGKFTFEGVYTKGQSYGFGHINDTFAVYFTKAGGDLHRYILQRINHKVFKKPEELMRNIEGITKHLREAIIKAGGNPDRETLNLIPAIDGKSFYKDIDGNYWRAYIFIEGARTYQVVEKPEHFYKAGKAFGRFQKLLDSYPASTLSETIPNFHNTKKRFGAFEEAVKKDIMNRAKDVKPEIEFAFKRAGKTGVLLDLLGKGELPLRVTHNDTKFNNVMIDDFTGEGLCVIDLDTVMPGLSLYDFGDSIRFGTNPAEEDEKNLDKVWMDINLFEEFTKGFLESAGGSLTGTELDYLPLSARIMTYECGIRFL